MMKKIAISIVVFFVFSIGIFLFISREEEISQKDQEVLQKTLAISTSYTALRYKTDTILIGAREYLSYQVWQEEMDSIKVQWLDMEREALELERIANEMAEETVGIKIIQRTLAYDKEELSTIFDRAPAGKKIATLAKHLGVDAKKAYAILTQDQAQVEADAWNEAGDTFKKLEITAVAIKDVCKVATFVGTIALTGGTSALATGSTLSKVAVVVSGADLTLEVTDDAAKIALGDKNKISAVVGKVKEVTEPVSAILMISTLPNNLTKTIEKLGVVTFGAEQLNSTVQEGKVIGIKLPSPGSSSSSKNMTVSVLENQEVEEWVSSEGGSFESQIEKDIADILDFDGAGEISEKMVIEEKTPSVAQQDSKDTLEPSQSGDNESIVGTWKGILSFTQSSEAEEQAIDFVLEIQEEGAIAGEAREAYDSWELIDGNVLRLALSSEDGEGYDEFRLSGNSLTYVKRAGINSEGVWQEDHAESDFFGGKFIQIHLTKQ